MAASAVADTLWHLQHDAIPALGFQCCKGSDHLSEILTHAMRHIKPGNAGGISFPSEPWHHITHVEALVLRSSMTMQLEAR